MWILNSFPGVNVDIFYLNPFTSDRISNEPSMAGKVVFILVFFNIAILLVRSQLGVNLGIALPLVPVECGSEFFDVRNAIEPGVVASPRMHMFFFCGHGWKYDFMYILDLDEEIARQDDTEPLGPEKRNNVTSSSPVVTGLDRCIGMGSAKYLIRVFETRSNRQKT